jgi:hypothetical protein
VSEALPPGRALPIVQHLRLDASTLGREQPLSGEAADRIIELYEALEFAERQLDELINRHYGGSIPCTDEEAGGFERIERALAKVRGEQ